MDDLDTSLDRSGQRLRLFLTVRRVDNLLAVAGDLDLATAPRLAQVLQRLETFSRPLCIDLATLHFADSGGWRVLETAQLRRRQSKKCSMRLIHLTGQPSRLVAVLERIGRLEPDVDPRRRTPPLVRPSRVS